MAQDVGMKMSQIRKGSYYVVKTSRDYYTYVHRGKSRGLYAVDWLPGKDPNSKKDIITHYMDSKGQTVKSVTLRGVYEFDPHNCQRTIGTCNYVETYTRNSDGKVTVLEFKRINKRTKTGYSSEGWARNKYGKMFLDFRGNYDIDEKGVIVSAKQKSKGSYFKFKVVASNY